MSGSRRVGNDARTERPFRELEFSPSGSVPQQAKRDVVLTDYRGNPTGAINSSAGKLVEDLGPGRALSDKTTKGPGLSTCGSSARVAGASARKTVHVLDELGLSTKSRFVRRALERAVKAPWMRLMADKDDQRRILLAIGALAEAATESTKAVAQRILEAYLLDQLERAIPTGATVREREEYLAGLKGAPKYAKLRERLSLAADRTAVQYKELMNNTLKLALSGRVILSAAPLDAWEHLAETLDLHKVTLNRSRIPPHGGFDDATKRRVIGSLVHELNHVANSDTESDVVARPGPHQIELGSRKHEVIAETVVMILGAWIERAGVPPTLGEVVLGFGLVVDVYYEKPGLKAGEAERLRVIEALLGKDARDQSDLLFGGWSLLQYMRARTYLHCLNNAMKLYVTSGSSQAQKLVRHYLNRLLACMPAGTKLDIRRLGSPGVDWTADIVFQLPSGQRMSMAQILHKSSEADLRLGLGPESLHGRIDVPDLIRRIDPYRDVLSSANTAETVMDRHKRFAQQHAMSPALALSETLRHYDTFSTLLDAPKAEEEKVQAFLRKQARKVSRQAESLLVEAFDGIARLRRGLEVSGVSRILLYDAAAEKLLHVAKKVETQ